jgi:hypothetical protein
MAQNHEIGPAQVHAKHPGVHCQSIFLACIKKNSFAVNLYPEGQTMFGKQSIGRLVVHQNCNLNPRQTHRLSPSM